MLPHKYRIPKKDIPRVVSEGKRFSGAYGTFSILKNEGAVSRFAIRIGLTFHKRAVVRNHVKRLFFESMRTILPTLKKPIDILYSVRHMSQSETKENMTKTLEKELTKTV